MTSPGKQSLEDALRISAEQEAGTVRHAVLGGVRDPVTALARLHTDQERMEQSLRHGWVCDLARLLLREGEERGGGDSPPQEFAFGNWRVAVSSHQLLRVAGGEVREVWDHAPMPVCSLLADGEPWLLLRVSGDGDSSHAVVRCSKGKPLLALAVEDAGQGGAPSRMRLPPSVGRFARSAWRTLPAQAFVSRPGWVDEPRTERKRLVLPDGVRDATPTLVLPAGANWVAEYAFSDTPSTSERAWSCLLARALIHTPELVVSVGYAAASMLLPFLSRELPGTVLHLVSGGDQRGYLVHYLTAHAFCRQSRAVHEWSLPPTIAVRRLQQAGELPVFLSKYTTECGCTGEAVLRAVRTGFAGLSRDDGAGAGRIRCNVISDGSADLGWRDELLPAVRNVAVPRGHVTALFGDEMSDVFNVPPGGVLRALVRLLSGRSPGMLREAISQAARRSALPAGAISADLVAGAGAQLVLEALGLPPVSLAATFQALETDRRALPRALSLNAAFLLAALGREAADGQGFLAVRDGKEPLEDATCGCFIRLQGSGTVTGLVDADHVLFTERAVRAAANAIRLRHWESALEELRTSPARSLSVRSLGSHRVAVCLHQRWIVRSLENPVPLLPAPHFRQDREWVEPLTESKGDPLALLGYEEEPGLPRMSADEMEGLRRAVSRAPIREYSGTPERELALEPLLLTLLSR